MPADTAVETPAANPEISEEKKEIAAEEAAAAAEKAAAEEKKDAEKAEGKDEEAAKAKKEKAAKKEKPPPPPPVHKKDFEKDVVYMYQFNRTPAVPSFSPYCLKLETWLKINGIKYENVDHGGKLRSKRGLLPFVELNGEEIADSDLIINSLSATLDKDMDAGMGEEQVGVMHAMDTMIAGHLHWCFLQWMNRDPTNVIRGYNTNLQKVLGSKLPNSVLEFMMKHTYFRKSQKRVKAAGFGCYTDAEIDGMSKKDLKTLSDLLGEKDFFFGEEPRSLDVKAFVYLAMILNVNDEVACPMRDFLREECKNLEGAYERVRDRAWGEHWAEATGDKMELNPHIPKPEPEVKEEEKKEEKEGEKKEGEEKKDEEKKEGEEDNKEKEEEEKK